MTDIRTGSLLAAALACAMAAACSDRSKPDRGEPAPAKDLVGTRITQPGPLEIDRAAFLAWLHTAAPDAPVVRVGDRVATARVFQTTERVFLATFADQRLAPPPDTRIADYLGETVDDRVVKMTLRAMAEADGQVITRERARAFADQMRAYVEASKGEVPPDDELLDRAREALLVNALVDSRLQPTDADLQSYVRAHADQLRLRDGVYLSEIVIAIEARDEGAARSRAQSLAEEVRLFDAAAFARRAGEISARPQSATPTWIDLSQFPPEIRSALEAAAPDTVVGPLAGPLGLHIFRVHRRASDHLPPIVEIRDRVAEAWREQQRPAARQALYAEGLANHEVMWLL